MISMQVSQEVTQPFIIGKCRIPEVTVTADGIETLSDKDMTITYLKEVTTGSSAGTYTEVDECKDAGNYKIRVTGKRKHSGKF